MSLSKQQESGGDEEGYISPLEKEEAGISPPEKGEETTKSTEKDEDVSPPEKGEESRSSTEKDEGDVSPPEKDDDDISPPEMCENGYVVVDNASIEAAKENVKANGNAEGTSTNKTIKRRATIMVAGRARNGKSTALNNVFGLDLVAKASAKSVTQVVSTTEVTKKISINELEEEEVTLQVIDTPGLGATDIKKEDIVKDMKKITQGVDYTLMYCFSVSPNTIILETDKAIVKNLYLSLGKDVWNKCVLLFTFSDHAYLEFEDSKEEYIEHIKSHAREFEKLLQSIRSDAPSVKTIFDYESPEKLEQEENPSGIIAIPVNKKAKNSKSILPGMLKRGQDWTDVVFIELMKKTAEEDRVPFFYFRYPNLFLGAGATGAGAAIGAGTGAIVGVLGGPLGVAAGAGIGALLGVAGAGVAGFTIKGVVSLVSWIKKKNSEKKY